MNEFGSANNYFGIDLGDNLVDGLNNYESSPLLGTPSSQLHLHEGEGAGPLGSGVVRQTAGFGDLYYSFGDLSLSYQGGDINFGDLNFEKGKNEEPPDSMSKPPSGGNGNSMTRPKSQTPITRGNLAFYLREVGCC